MMRNEATGPTVTQVLFMCGRNRLHSPHWLRYFIQTTELDSIHHQFEVQDYNFSDIPPRDRLFATYRDASAFAGRSGFPDGA
jgi:sterol desaturase/sphingolipid hydroxylase (fatty acid hydroxylase superfamily)